MSVVAVVLAKQGTAMGCAWRAASGEVDPGSKRKHTRGPRNRMRGMNQRPDSPGVNFPPPLLYAGAVVGGWLLDRAWPLSIGDGTGRTTLGWVFVAGWALLAASAIGLFRRKQTSMITFRPASALVTSGPYAFTRNPMYVSLALLTIAFALFLSTWWIVILLIPTLLAMQQIVIVPEEHYLRRRFGAEYEAYMRRVRRWV